MASFELLVKDILAQATKEFMNALEPRLQAIEDKQATILSHMAETQSKIEPRLAEVEREFAHLAHTLEGDNHLYHECIHGVKTRLDNLEKAVPVQATKRSHDVMERDSDQPADHPATQDVEMADASESSTTNEDQQPAAKKLKFETITAKSIEEFKNADIIKANKEGVSMHNVDAVKAAMVKWDDKKGKNNPPDALQSDTAKWLSVYCNWNGDNELADQYSKHAQELRKQKREARNKEEAGTLPTQAEVLKAIDEKFDWTLDKEVSLASKVHQLQLYLQTLTTVRSDLAFLTVDKTDHFPHYDPETELIYGSIVIKTAGHGYDFKHRVADDQANMLAKFIKYRRDQGFDFVFADSIDDAKALCKKWCQDVGRSGKLVGLDVGVQKLRRISASENTKAYNEIKARAHAMGHSVGVHVDTYMVGKN
ncbi:hypothetical protein H9P43_006443 [Blastocladiella emersonii ATCC 22665]|nr:hypothetical protein H9P43_006443 [Blastocladiella emersonii ATCC 22665]